MVLNSISFKKLHIWNDMIKHLGVNAAHRKLQKVINTIIFRTFRTEADPGSQSELSKSSRTMAVIRLRLNKEHKVLQVPKLGQL